MLPFYTRYSIYLAPPFTYDPVFIYAPPFTYAPVFVHAPPLLTLPLLPTVHYLSTPPFT